MDTIFRAIEGFARGAAIIMASYLTARMACGALTATETSWYWLGIVVLADIGWSRSSKD